MPIGHTKNETSVDKPWNSFGDAVQSEFLRRMMAPLSEVLNAIHPPNPDGSPSDAAIALGQMRGIEDVATLWRRPLAILSSVLEQYLEHSSVAETPVHAILEEVPNVRIGDKRMRDAGWSLALAGDAIAAGGLQVVNSNNPIPIRALFLRMAFAMSPETTLPAVIQILNGDVATTMELRVAAVELLGTTRDLGRVTIELLARDARGSTFLTQLCLDTSLPAETREMAMSALNRISIFSDPVLSHPSGGLDIREGLQREGKFSEPFLDMARRVR